MTPVVTNSRLGDGVDQAGMFPLDAALTIERYFLGNDDHDLMARAWSGHRWRCGFLPVAFSSPLQDGATRQEKTPRQKARFMALSEHYRQQFASRMLARVHDDDFIKPGSHSIKLR